MTKHLPCVVPPVVADGGIVPVWFTGWALDGCTTIHKIIPLFILFFIRQVKEIKKKKNWEVSIYVHIQINSKFILDMCLTTLFLGAADKTTNKLSRPDISQTKTIQLCILLFNFKLHWIYPNFWRTKICNQQIKNKSLSNGFD